jgi:hypothetical protein
MIVIRHASRIFVSFFLTLTISTIYAQDVCNDLVESALEVVANHCDALTRNEACYGNAQLTATGRSVDFTFNAVGDIEDVTNLDTITTTALNPDDSEWGIAVLNLQANLPDTLPGQNVTLLVLGNTAIQNQVADTVLLSATVNTDARVRAAPVDGQVIFSFVTGTTVMVFGRNEAGDWLRVVDDQLNYGWIAAFLLDSNDDFSTLPVTEIDAELPPAPMQAFTLGTGITGTTCANTPEGTLVQTPDDILTVQFTINGVTINMASTLHLRVASEGNEAVLLVQTLEGTGIISNDFGVSVAPAGTQVTVPLDNTGTQPVAAPSNPMPIPQSDLDALNNIVLSSGYAQLLNSSTTAPETVTEALTVTDVDLLLTPPNNTDAMSGSWEWVFFVRYEGGSACYNEGQAPGRYGGLITIEFNGDSMTTTNSRGFSTTYTRSSGATFSTFDTATFAFTVVSPVYMTYERTPASAYTVNGVNCTQSIDGYAVRR